MNNNNSKIAIGCLILILVITSFTGCTLYTNSNNGADVELEGFTHHETFELPARYISALSLTFQNKGNANAENIMFDIEIMDYEGIGLYSKEVALNSPLGPGKDIVQTIDFPYDLEKTLLEADISISWDGGTHHYIKEFTQEFKEYGEIMLESMTHHESYNSSNGYTTAVNLLFQNRGNLIAENVKIHVIVYDDGKNENYNKEENMTSLLLPWEVKSNEITVPYDFDDVRLDLSINVSWDGGTNHYTRSFKPEFNEYANVKLDSFTHYEQYKLFVGYVSTVAFILQNKGSEIADNVRMHIVVHDNGGNEAYNSEMIVISALLPGEIKPYEITVPYDFDDVRLDLSINVSWDGGTNHYSDSFEPRTLF